MKVLAKLLAVFAALSLALTVTACGGSQPAAETPADVPAADGAATDAAPDEAAPKKLEKFEGNKMQQSEDE